MSRFESEAKANGRGAAWRQATLESLLPLSLGQLHKVERDAFTADALSSAVAAAEAEDPQVFGDTTQDLVYFPITPCRYVDTRAVGGPINGIRGYDIVLSGASYGGSGACNPTVQFGVGENSFGALAMNVTIVDPQSGPGFLAVKPTAASPVTSLLNWYNAGAGVQVANAGIVTLDQSGAADEFVVQTSNPTQVIIDIFGAFLAPNATALQTTTLLTAQVPLGANANGTVSTLSCPTGYSLTGGGCIGFSFNLELVTSRSQGNNWFCSYQNNAAVATTIQAQAICSRVPGR